MKRKLIIALAAIGLFLTGAAQAGNYGISPLDLKFNGDSKSGVVTVVNEDKRPIELRVRPTSWTQNELVDSYVDANDLQVFPRRITINPGEKKIVRIALGATTGATEQAYRVYFEEIAPPDLPAEDKVKLAVLVNVGIPVFFNPNPAPANVAINAASSGNGLTLDVVNNGTRHIRFARIVDEKGQLVFSNFSQRYFLVGSKGRLNIALPATVCKGQAVNWKLETSEAQATPINVTLPAQCTGKAN